MRLIEVILVVSFLLTLAAACRGAPNPYPIVDSHFQRVAIHQYGEKYHYYSPEANQNFYLLRLWGTPYQAGFAYGTLMREELKQNLKNIWKYLEDNIEHKLKFISKLPDKLKPAARAIGVRIVKNVLMANHYYVLPFTPKHFLDEYAGLSAGSGIPAKDIIGLNMLPEIERAGCSILGVFGKATVNGDLIHLRALDWDINNPMHLFPTLTIYNVKLKGSLPFMNVAWAGFIGSLTGFGQYTGIGEQLRKQNPTKQNETRFGKPWTYALRDVIQFSETIDQALTNLNNTHRTCSIHVGISNIKNNTFRLINYSHKEFDVFDDKHYPFSPIHDQMDGVVSAPVHEDKGDSCFNDLLKVKYGSIEEEWVTNTLAASHHTGDTQMATYNFNKKVLLLQVSNQTLRAYERPTVRISLAEHFTFTEEQS